MNDLDKLYQEMKSCQACKLRDGCAQVVPGTGQTDRPVLMVVAEAPGQDEDLQGIPMVGRAGQLLREVIRETGTLNKRNTLLTNVLGCRPPKNKFPTDESPSVCASKWLFREIEIAKPERMLLVGGKALWHVAAMKGITVCRGQWYDVRGVRTMATFHPSYVLRQEGDGKMQFRQILERDLQEVAEEVASIEKKRKASTGSGTPNPDEADGWRAETQAHIDEVSRLLARFSEALAVRARKHDASKLEEPEASVFAEYTGKLRGITYGSDEYKANLEKMRPALEHHYANNSHHAEFHEIGVDGMTLIDVVECFLDWLAATKRHADGDILRSIAINEKRFNLSPQLASILRNTAKEFEEK